ncbi:MAG: patatin-like phospholipase family protein [Natronospirillum sp.]|uniref:patatin-like phospholipase family protein n=1 Tax=Natronospirillum sp. TaxID=2812955 RepID=UPI0026013582|nr:patatin-like phospholipase family protein [Natronospirillum sp.]MCH8550681.1 patatin-like phospholipase family protein [Natronospirillum sp.]
MLLNNNSPSARCLCCLLGLLLGGLATAEERADPDRPVVGLVLGGGGAKGLVHVGALRALEELQVPVDLIVGTSMGAITGGLYAQGNTAEDLAELVLTTDWQALFVDQPSRPLLSSRRRAESRDLPFQGTVGLDRDGPQFRLGLLRGQRLLPTLRSHGANRPVPHDLDDLPVPFRAMAVDIETGQTIALADGDINKAMRASMAIPGLFSPVEIDDRFLVDGGVVNNLPINVAREMGADIVIVVDAVGNLKPLSDLNSPFSVVEQALNIVIRQGQASQMEVLLEDDIMILPQITEAGVSGVDFDQGQVAISVGEAAAMLEESRLRELSVDEAEWDAWRSELTAYRQPFQPDFLTLDNQTALPDERLWATLTAEPGEHFDEALFQEDLGRLYGLGYFEQVDYQPIEVDGEQGAQIVAHPSTTGPGYLRFGLSLEEGFERYSRYTAAVSYLETEVNGMGAEWQVDLQVGQEALLGFSWWQPLRRDGRVHLTPSVALQQDNLNLYDSRGEAGGRYRILRGLAGVALGFNWGNRVDLQLDYVGGAGHAQTLSPGPGLPDEGRFSVGAVGAQLLADSLDSVVLPRKGHLLKLRYEVSDPTVGAEAGFQTLDLQWQQATTWRRNTLVSKLRYSTTLDGELPFYATWKQGGLLQLSAYSPQELSGQARVLGKLAYWRQLNDLQRFGDLPFFVGVAAETGQVWQQVEDQQLDDLVMAGSVLAATETPLGTGVVAYSRNSDDRSALVVALNRPF